MPFENYKVFHSGKQEHKLLTALCEHQWLFPPLLSGGSSSSLSSFVPRKQKYSAEVSRGPSLYLYAFFLCSSLLLYSTLYPRSFNHFGLFGLPGLFPQLRETSGLCCGAPFLSCNLESLSKHQLGPSQDSIHLFSFSQGSLPCTAWWPVSENCCFIYIIRSFSFFEWDNISSFCSESKCQNNFWRQDLYYDVIWLLLTEGSEDTTSWEVRLCSEKNKTKLKLSTLEDLSSNSSTATLGKLPVLSLV